MKTERFRESSLFNQKKKTGRHDEMGGKKRPGLSYLCRKPESGSWESFFSLKLFQDPDSGFLHRFPSLAKRKYFLSRIVTSAVEKMTALFFIKLNLNSQFSGFWAISLKYK